MKDKERGITKKGEREKREKKEKGIKKRFNPYPFPFLPSQTPFNEGNTIIKDSKTTPSTFILRISKVMHIVMGKDSDCFFHFQNACIMRYSLNELCVLDMGSYRFSLQAPFQISTKRITHSS